MCEDYKYYCDWEVTSHSIGDHEPLALSPKGKSHEIDIERNVIFPDHKNECTGYLVTYACDWVLPDNKSFFMVAKCETLHDAKVVGDKAAKEMDDYYKESEGVEKLDPFGFLEDLKNNNG
jgi:hypothetical protein